MLRRIVTFGGISILSAAPLLADFSYQQKSTLTGGMLASAMKVAGVFSKQAREPMMSTTAVKGDRMLRSSPGHVEIIDLSNQTITNVDLQKKTYSVMTFAEMKQALEQMQQSMQKKKSDDPDVQLKVSANNTGATRTIGPYIAKETVVTIEMAATDQQSNQSGALVVTTDVWLAPPVDGYREIRDFQRRMAEKLDWAPGSNMFAGRPDVSKGMSESAKQLGALDGMPVFEVMSMGAAGGPTNQSQTQTEKPSLGSALGGRFGISRKKQSTDQPAPSQTSAPAVPNGLMEMTVEMSNFSGAPVDEAQFAIPAGFKKIEPDLRRGGR
jgi:hypothetical protein